VFGLCCYTSDTGQAEVVIWNMVHGLSPDHRNGERLQREPFAHAVRSLAHHTTKLGSPTLVLITHFAAKIMLIKGKAVPLQAWSGPEGSRKLRFPGFMTTAQDGGKVVSLTHRPPLPPWNAPGTHFCWRLSQPQGHSVIGRILCQWKIHWH